MTLEFPDTTSSFRWDLPWSVPWVSIIGLGDIDGGMRTSPQIMHAYTSFEATQEALQSPWRLREPATALRDDADMRARPTPLRTAQEGNLG